MESYEYAIILLSAGLALITPFAIRFRTNCKTGRGKSASREILKTLRDFIRFDLISGLLAELAFCAPLLLWGVNTLLTWILGTVGAVLAWVIGREVTFLTLGMAFPWSQKFEIVFSEDFVELRRRGLSVRRFSCENLKNLCRIGLLRVEDGNGSSFFARQAFRLNFTDGRKVKFRLDLPDNWLSGLEREASNRDIQWLNIDVDG